MYECAYTLRMQETCILRATRTLTHKTPPTPQIVKIFFFYFFTYKMKDYLWRRISIFLEIFYFLINKYISYKRDKDESERQHEDGKPHDRG